MIELLEKSPPDCPLGYSEGQLRKLLGDEGMANFKKWMVGQTVGICEGRYYDHEKECYLPSICAEMIDGPHGVVYYAHDVERFLLRKPIID